MFFPFLLRGFVDTVWVGLRWLMWNCSERRKGVQQITEIESLESGKDDFGEKGKGDKFAVVAVSDVVR